MVFITEFYMKKIINQREVNVASHDLYLPKSMGGKGHFLQVLVQIAEQLDAMLSYHCKVLVTRIDLRLYQGTKDNKPVSDFIRRLRKHLVTNGHKRFAYVWCREQNCSDVQHYHFALITDANANRHPHKLIKLIEYLWEAWGHVKPFIPKNCYSIIKRGDEDAFAQQFSRLSYLAKVDTKQNRSKSTNDYSTSRLKIK